MTPTTTADINDLFLKEGLPLPPVPSSVTNWLRTGEHSFSTRSSELGLYDIAGHVEEALKGTADYVATGFDGHGINSWAMHFYLVDGPLALFIQCRWGNAYDDAARALQRIDGALSFAAMLQEAMKKAVADHVLPAGERLVLCFSDRVPSGWQWTSEPASWHDEGDFTFLDALNAVRERAEAMAAKS